MPIKGTVKGNNSLFKHLQVKIQPVLLIGKINIHINENIFMNHPDILHSMSVPKAQERIPRILSVILN